LVIEISLYYDARSKKHKKVNTWTTVNELRQWNKSQPHACKVRHTLIH